MDLNGKISSYRGITIVTYTRIFLECNEKGELEIFILAEFKLFLWELFWIDKTAL